MTSRFILLFMVVAMAATGVGIFAIFQIKLTADRREQVNHTYAVRSALRELNIAMVEAEAAARAGSASGPTAKDRITRSTDRARRALATFTELTRDNPVQQRAAADMAPRLDDYLLDVSLAAASIMQQDGFEEVTEAQEGLAAAIGSALVEEERLLALRLDSTASSLAQSERLLVGAVVLAVLAMGAAFAVVLRELRRRRRSEAVLRDQSQILTTTFDAMAQGLVVVDLDCRVAVINRAACALLHVPQDVDFVGRPFLDLLAIQVGLGFFSEEEARQRVDQLAADIAAQRSSQSEVTRRDGRIIELHRRSYPGGMVTTYSDVTERHRTERMKNEFISTVSHELRTPLTSIRGSLGLIVGGAVGEVAPKVREMVSIAHANSERLVRLINDILDIEKIESGRLQFDIRPQPVGDLVTQALKDNAGYFQQYDARPRLADEAPGALIRVDADRFMQVLNNLLSNAAKHTPAGGVVQVQLARGAGRVRLSVGDDGPGIPEEFRSRIFGKFEQADSSDSRRKGGTGLGLSITKAIVERMDGRIWFDSTVGVGTVFHVEIPEMVVAPMPASAAPRGDDADPRPAILVVEDDQDVARLLTLMLEQNGWRVTVAHSAADATARLAVTRFAAMTLDIMLPDEDGLSFFRRLRLSPATRDLPVVVVSAKAGNARKELNGDAIGIVDWLEKPIDQARLGRAIRQAIGAVEGPITILHVEDDPDIVRIVGVVMGDGVNVVAASTLAAARVRLATQHFSVVVVDVGLPDGSGLDLLGEIRRLVPPPPVVIFSASDFDPASTTHVAAALVKSRTDNSTLHQTINGLIRDLVPDDVDGER
ncbi:hybrid sensor histidine kinase/response regulator [Allostella humosa]|nr:response regulator [Stella humosa]